MKEYVFPGYCTFGKCDSGTSYIYVDLTDEEEELLLKYALVPSVYYGHFWKCNELSKLYDRILEIADEQITEELSGADMLEEDEDASDCYQIRVDFPEELEDYLLED